MRVYYEKRAAEYDDWWRGTGLFAARERPGWHEDVEALGVVLRGAGAGADVRPGVRHGVPHALAAGGGDRASTRARRWSRSRTRAARTGPSRSATRWSRGRASSGSSPRTSTATWTGAAGGVPRAAAVLGAGRGRLGAAAGGVAEDWQERVLYDGSRHSVYKRWFTASGLARGDRRRGALRRAVVRRRQEFEPALLNEVPWRALAEREVRRQRRAAVPGGRRSARPSPGRA